MKEHKEYVVTCVYRHRIAVFQEFKVDWGTQETRISFLVNEMKNK